MGTTNFLFHKSLVCHFVKYHSFCHSVWIERKNPCFELCVTLVLTQNADIRNFHGSLTLNNGKLIGYFGSPWYAIVSNMTHFFIRFAMRKQWPFLNYVFLVLTQNRCIKNFHGSLTSNDRKAIFIF